MNKGKGGKTFEFKIPVSPKKQTPKKKSSGKRVYRDEIEGMPKIIRRLIKKVKETELGDGVRFQAGLADEIKLFVHPRIAKCVQDVVVHAEYLKKKTITTEIVNHAMKKKVYAKNDVVGQKAAFKRYMREIIKRVGIDSMRVTSDAFDMLQMVYEDMVMRTLVFLVKHTKMMERNTVMARDVKLAKEARQEICGIIDLSFEKV